MPDFPCPQKCATDETHHAQEKPTAASDTIQRQALKGEPLPAHRFHVESEHALGMSISLTLRGRHTDDDKAAAAWVQVKSELRRVEKMFSTYRLDPGAGRLRSGVSQWPAEIA